MADSNPNPQTDLLGRASAMLPASAESRLTHGGTVPLAFNSLFTVGYEGRTVDELIRLLNDNGVRTLVDVRLTPISHKPGFSKERLRAALTRAGIDYVHEPRLGNPKDNREAYRAGRPSARRRYLDHIHQSGDEAILRITDSVRLEPMALLCFEREPTLCHRTAIAHCVAQSVVSL
jgi:hypothetical protein